MHNGACVLIYKGGLPEVRWEEDNLSVGDLVDLAVCRITHSRGIRATRPSASQRPAGNKLSTGSSTEPCEVVDECNTVSNGSNVVQLHFQSTQGCTSMLSYRCLAIDLHAQLLDLAIEVAAGLACDITSGDTSNCETTQQANT